MNRSFPYPRARPMANMVAALLLAGGCTLLLSLLGDAGVLWLTAFAVAVFATTFVVYVTPMLTDHFVADAELRLRYGWVFMADIPLRDVAGARALDAGEKAKGALDLTTEKTRRVLVTLKGRRRFAHALWRSYGAIAVSVDDVPRFVEALGGGGE